MYARYYTFKSDPGKRKAIESIADDIYRYTKTLKGFVSATYFISTDATEYGSFTVWESKEDAEEAASRIRVKLAPALEGLVTVRPEVAILEVYEPKS